MVVLDAGNGEALDQCLDALYAHQDLSLKVLHKRYIGLHQWVGPLAAPKDVKLQLVSTNILAHRDR
jgi:hypothetical protein